MFQVEAWGLIIFYDSGGHTASDCVASSTSSGEQEEEEEINFHFVPGDWRGVSGTRRPSDIGVVFFPPNKYQNEAELTLI